MGAENSPSYRSLLGLEAVLTDEQAGLKEVQTTWVGALPFVRGAWGLEVSNEDFFVAAARAGEFDAVFQQSVQASGFDGGRYYPVDVSPFSEQAQRWNSQRAADLAESAIRERWEVDRETGKIVVERLVVATNSMRVESVARVGEILEERGIVVRERIDQYGAACAGMFQAMVDYSHPDNSEIKTGDRVAFVAVDTPTGTVSPEDWPVLYTFSNGGVGTAYEARMDFEVIADDTLFVYDTRESMKAPSAFNFDDPSEPHFVGDHILLEDVLSRVRPWYRIREGGEDHIVFTDKGMFVRLPGSDQLEMNGSDLMKLFRPEISSLVLSNLVEWVEDEMIREEIGLSQDDIWASLAEVLGTPVSHLASEQVIHAVNVVVLRAILEKFADGGKIEKIPPAVFKAIRDLPLEQRIVHVREKYGVDITPYQVKFVMGGSGVRNISPGTGAVGAMRLQELGYFEQEKYRLMIRFGIGTLMGVSLVRFADRKVAGVVEEVDESEKGAEQAA